MIITNTEEVPNRKVSQILGMVRGNTVRARNVGRDITQAFRNIAGGELKAYTELLAEAREEALNRMIAEAEKLNADAVINVRFTTSAITAGGAEIMAYGTAVKL